MGGYCDNCGGGPHDLLCGGCEDEGVVPESSAYREPGPESSKCQICGAYASVCDQCAAYPDLACVRLQSKCDDLMFRISQAEDEANAIGIERDRFRDQRDRLLKELETVARWRHVRLHTEEGRLAELEALIKEVRRGS